MSKKSLDLKQGIKKKIDSFSKAITEIDNNNEKMYMDKLKVILT